MTFLIGLFLSLGLGILARLLLPDPPNQVIEGPRLDDLSVTHSAFGQAIFVSDGKIALAGGVIWAKELREVAITIVEEIGDGGLFGTGFLERTSTVTTIEYRYFLDWAVSFGEGVAGRYLRIWMNDKLVYDTREGETFVDLMSQRARNISGAAYTADLGVQFVSQIPQPSWTWYAGENDQEADPLIRADVDGRFGLGSTPAYAGITYARWTNMPVIEFGNTPPNVRAEIDFNSYGSTETYPRDDLSELPGLTDPGEWHWGYSPRNNMVYVGSEALGGELLLIDPGSMTHLATVATGGEFWAQDSGCLTSDGKLIALVATLGGTNGHAVGRFNLESGQRDGLAGAGSGSTGDENGVSFNRLGAWADETLKIATNAADGIAAEVACHFPSNGGVGLVETRTMTFQEDNIGMTAIATGGDAAAGVGVGLPVYDPKRNRVYFFQQWTEHTDVLDPGKLVLFRLDWNGAFDGVGLEGNAFTVHYDGPQAGITLTEVGRWDPDTELFAPAGVCLLIEDEKLIVSNGAKAHGDSNARLAVIDLSDGSLSVSPAETSYGSFQGVHKVWGGRFAFPNVNGIAEIRTHDLSLVRQHDAADDIGLTESAGKAFDSDFMYDPNLHAVYVDRRFAGGPSDSPARTRIPLLRASTVGTTELNDIIARYAARVGLTDGDHLNLLATDGIAVDGYSLTQAGMTAASGLEPLLTGFMAVLIDSGWEVRSGLRGGAVVDAIPEDHLGERQSDDDAPPVKETRTSELEIPRRVEVGYNDAGLLYEKGQQPAMRMVAPLPTMRSVSPRRVDLGTLVMGPAEARRLAEKLLWTMWEERVILQTRVPWDYLLLDPGDVVDITYRGEVRRVRIGSMEHGANRVIELRATQEAAHAATSEALAETERGTLIGLPLGSAPTRLILLNLPTMRARDETGGAASVLYVGASGYGDALWRGVTVTQGGAAVAVLDEALPWGVVSSPPSAWDALRDNRFQEVAEGGELTVTMRDGASRLEESSITGNLDEALDLDGDHVAVIVTGGTAEVVQFRDVTPLGSGRYTIGRLLRGRFGTEDVALDTAHAAGSLFALVRFSALRTVHVPLSEVGAELRFQAVSFGADIVDAIEYAHTPDGRDRRPLGPALISASVDNTMDELEVTWRRRGRVNALWGQGGTSSIPLVPEDLNEFTVVLRGTESDAGPGVTKVVSGTSVTFTEAEVSQVVGFAWGVADPLPAGLTVDVTQSSGTPGIGGITTTEVLV